MHRKRFAAALASAVAAGCLLGAPAGARADGLTAAMDATGVTIRAPHGPALRYRASDVPFKPYVAELYTPSGVQILRDSPHDHKHHHALMFAVAAAGVDFWAETPACGKQLGRSLEASRTGSGAQLSQELAWVGPGASEPVLLEKRTVEVLDGELPATLLTWRSRLAPPPGTASVTLTGSHYFGLGMRFVTSMDQGGRFFNPENIEGPIVRGSERVTPVRWMAYAAEADGKPVTVALFDSPANPRHPATMFTMAPFAYLSATLNLWKEPLTVAADSPLDLRYGVALWDGHPAPEQVESLYRLWVGKTKE